MSGWTMVARAREVFTNWGAWDEALRVSLISSLARIGARWVALNLLPLASLAGGQLVARVLPERMRGKFNFASFFLLFALIVFGLFR